jgi:hypothetical protein
MISTRCHAMGVGMSMVVFTVTNVATVRAKAKIIQNFRDHARPRYKYLLMTLNSSSDLRPTGELHEGKVVGCELVLVRGDASTMLDFIEEPLESGGNPTKSAIRASKYCLSAI